MRVFIGIYCLWFAVWLIALANMYAEDKGSVRRIDIIILPTVSSVITFGIYWGLL